jgi:hypothetical protein
VPVLVPVVHKLWGENKVPARSTLLPGYLKDLFTRLPGAKISQIQEFAPVVWAKAKTREKALAPAG